MAWSYAALTGLSYWVFFKNWEMAYMYYDEIMQENYEEEQQFGDVEPFDSIPVEDGTSEGFDSVDSFSEEENTAEAAEEPQQLSVVTV